MNIKVDFDNIVVKEDKNDFNVKVLMLKGEKGDAGESGQWGNIGGNIANQTDLQNALNSKANQSALNTLSNQVSTNTSNISTINGQITDINGELDDYEDLFYGNATVNDEDTSITLDNTVEAKFESFDLKGNTSQNGTPTPSSPIPVNVVSGSNSIGITGKNLLNTQYFQKGSIDASTGQDSSSNTNARGSNYIPVLPNTTYTLSANKNIFQLRLSEYQSDKTHIKRNSSNQNVSSYTITTSANCYYIRWSLNYDNSTSTAQEIIDSIDLMLEKGPSATNYEPFGNTYNIDLPSGMELCKIENYQDYIYKDSDKWYLHKEIWKNVYNGSENITLQNTVNGIIGVRFPADYYAKHATIVISNYFKYSLFGPYYDNRSYDLITVHTTTDYQNLYCSAPDSSITTVEQFKTWLSTHNTEVYYALSTPITTEITDTTLISQLNALEQATSKNCETNISQVNDDLPFIIYAEAFANTFNGRMEGMDYKIDKCEVLNNKVTSITSGSTDSEYPSAKAVYDLFNSITDGDEVSY